MIAVLIILAVAAVLFTTGWVRPDAVAMLVVLALVATGTMVPADALAGFSSEAVVTIAALMVIGEGLVRTGVVRWVARRLEALGAKSERQLLWLNTAIPGVLSGFINIVAAAAFFIPVILRLSRSMQTSPRRVLMPMAYAALVGANLTLVGASHNLVISDLLASSEGQGFGFFEYSIVGAAFLVATLVYCDLLAPRLLKKEGDAEGGSEPPDLVSAFSLEDRLFELWVSDAGDGLPVSALPFDDDESLTLLAVVRRESTTLFPSRGRELVAGDLLLVQGRREDLEALEAERDELVNLGTPSDARDYPVSDGQLMELVVPPRSPLIGRPTAEIELLDDLVVLGLHRDGEPRRTKLESTELRAGDGLLVYGARRRLDGLEPAPELLVYRGPSADTPSPRLERRAPWAVVLLLAVIGVAALGWAPIAVSASAGAVFVVLLGMLPAGEVYGAIDGKTLVLVAGVIPLGQALDDSGAADMVGEALISVLGAGGPIAVLAGIAVVTMGLTQVMHNAAAAAIMAPVALGTAHRLGASPRAYCVGVLVACSAAFLLPYGHPAPMMVQSPGDYARKDYARFGLGLCGVTLLVIVTVIPMWFGL